MRDRLDDLRAGAAGLRPPRPKPWSELSPLERGAANVGIKWSSRLNVLLYRATGGRVGGRFLAGEPLLLLTTIGHKSHKRRTVPLIFLEDDDALVVVASKGGSPEHPDWYKNLTAEPRVDVQIGARVEPRIAETADAETRARLWPALAALYPPYQEYQDVTSREIPVVRLRAPR